LISDWIFVTRKHFNSAHLSLEQVRKRKYIDTYNHCCGKENSSIFDVLKLIFAFKLIGGHKQFLVAVRWWW
jgi:hypothetical protein